MWVLKPIELRSALAGFAVMPPEGAGGGGGEVGVVVRFKLSVKFASGGVNVPVQVTAFCARALPLHTNNRLAAMISALPSFLAMALSYMGSASAGFPAHRSPQVAMMRQKSNASTCQSEPTSSPGQNLPNHRDHMNLGTLALRERLASAGRKRANVFVAPGRREYL